MKKAGRRIVSLLMVLALAVGLFSGQALAAEAIDPDRSGSITLKYAYDGNAILDAEFDVYYIASVSPYREFSLAGDFKNYPVSLEDLDADGWNALAQTLYGYARRDNLAPLDQGVTDSTGTVSFPTKETAIKPGLYLVSGKTVTIGYYSYSTSPFIVSVPAEDLEKNVWNYSITVSPKADRQEYHDTVTRKALKVWDDKGSETERPTEIVVQLLKDGKVYKTATLSQENNWRHTWSGLDDRHEWLVTEKEPSGYTVKTEREGTTFVITNTYKPEEPAGETVVRKVYKIWNDKGYENKRPQDVTVTLLKNGAEYDTQKLTASGNWEYRWDALPRYDGAGSEIRWSIREGTVSGYTASVTQNGDTFVLTNSVDQPKLPQTGMLWWPVPLLIAAGLAFLLVGGLMKKHRKNR